MVIKTFICGLIAASITLISVVECETGHHSRFTVGVGEGKSLRHFILLGHFICEDGITTRTVSSLIIVIVNEDKCVSASQKSPAFTPVR